jgi:hypothetical protein
MYGWAQTLAKSGRRNAQSCSEEFEKKLRGNVLAYGSWKLLDFISQQKIRNAHQLYSCVLRGAKK